MRNAQWPPEQSATVHIFNARGHAICGFWAIFGEVGSKIELAMLAIPSCLATSIVLVQIKSIVAKWTFFRQANECSDLSSAGDSLVRSALVSETAWQSGEKCAMNFAARLLSCPKFRNRYFGHFGQTSLTHFVMISACTLWCALTVPHSRPDGSVPLI